MNITKSDETRIVKAGTLLVKESELSRKMYILRKGKIRVFKTYLDQRITLAILGEGEVFGELSFFDAEPRSASCEALTDVEVLIVDGDKASKQISDLPHWVSPIFKSVFHRFREADQKITVLQSMNEYQKKVFRTDSVAKAVYFELLRFIKTLKVLYERDTAGQPPGQGVESARLLVELDDILGHKTLGLKVFWGLLKDYDFMDFHREQNESRAVLREETLNSFNEYLSAETQSERFLMLGHPSLAILRRIVTLTPAEQAGDFELTFEAVRVGAVPLHEEALAELGRHSFIRITDRVFRFNPEEIFKLFHFQSLLKNFDHTIVNLS